MARSNTIALVLQLGQLQFGIGREVIGSHSRLRLHDRPALCCNS